MAAYIVIFGAFVWWAVNPATCIAFVVGAVTSIAAGWIGMRIAVYTNVRTTHQCWANLAAGYKVAIQGGSVMGLSLVGLGVVMLYALIKGFPLMFAEYKSLNQSMFEAIAGYGPR